jgi:hypothetical protein
MKSTTPFYPFPTMQGGSLGGEGAWGQVASTWHQGTAGGPGILVEAANRAQMDILVDDMGNMGMEQMELS